MPAYSDLWPKYAEQWDTMQRTRLSYERAAARRILENKARYQGVEKRTGVPWYMIGLIHMRESDFDFDTQLAQGDPLGRVSTHEPKGQGPYFGPDAWERAALIALEDKGLDKVKDWNLERILYYLEDYNGWGYYLYHRKMPSPYLWAGSTIQKPGKYVADGHFDSNATDKQLGAAPVLKSLMEIDSTILLSREHPGALHDVRWMQGQLGVEADGIVGPVTIAAMIRYMENHGG